MKNAAETKKNCLKIPSIKLNFGNVMLVERQQFRRYNKRIKHVEIRLPCGTGTWRDFVQVQSSNTEEWVVENVGH